MAKKQKLRSSSDPDSSSSSSHGDTKSPPPKNSGSDSDFSMPLKSKADTSVPRKSSRSKPSNAMDSPTKTPKKRALILDLEQDTPKRSKKENADIEDQGKKSAASLRLWSEDDEIVILEGILKFKDEKETDPMADKDGFYDFIKGSLHVKVDRRQLLDKVRKLKRRYENSVNKTKFTPHEQTSFNLSKKIWGKTLSKTADVKPAADVNPVSAKYDGNAANDNDENDDSVKSSFQFIGKTIVSMGMNEDLVKIGLELCSVDNKANMEEKWKKLYLEEADLFFRKLELAKEETKMINEALNSAGK